MNIMKKAVAVLFLSSIVATVNADDNERLVELAPVSSHLSVFNAYCMEDTDAFNIASRLVADGWVSHEDADLINNPQYRELFEEYANTILSSGEDLTVYTRELRSGVVFATIHHEQSGCSIIPLSDTQSHDVLGFLADRGVNTMSIMNTREGDFNISYHLYGNKVVGVTETRYNDSFMSHVISLHLDSNISQMMPDITNQLNQQ